MGEIPSTEITSTDNMTVSASLLIEESEFNALDSKNLVFKATNLTEPATWQFDSAQLKFESQYGGEYQSMMHQINCMTKLQFQEFVVKSDFPEINGLYTRDASAVPSDQFNHVEKDMSLLYSLREDGKTRDGNNLVFQDSSGNVFANRNPKGQCMTGDAFGTSGPWSITESGSVDDSIRFIPSKPHNKRTFKTPFVQLMYSTGTRLAANFGWSLVICAQLFAKTRAVISGRLGMLIRQNVKTMASVSRATTGFRVAAMTTKTSLAISARTSVIQAGLGTTVKRRRVTPTHVRIMARALRLCPRLMATVGTTAVVSLAFTETTVRSRHVTLIHAKTMVLVLSTSLP